MRKKITFLTIMSCMFAASPLIASEQSCSTSTRQERPHQKMFEQLNLTADQKEKLKALRKEFMESSKPIFDQIKASREKVKAELLKNEPSRSALDGYVAQLADLHKQMVGKWIGHILKVKAVLTADQFSKIVNFDWMGPGMDGMHRGGRGGDGDHQGNGPDKE